MTASAARYTSRTSRPFTSSPYTFAAAFLAGACLCTATPATAEVGATVSVFSDGRFRGYSISDGHPVALIDLSYDAPGGVYVAASGSAATSSDGVRPLGLQLNGGYAKRLSSGTTVDLGMVHSEYSRYSSAAPGNSYTEVYAGLTRKYLTGRIYLSPHYFETGTWTVYSELNADVSIAPKLSLNGHTGVLIPVRNRDDREIHPQYDWRLTLNRQFGRVSLHAAWTGSDPIHRYDGSRSRSGSSLVFGLSSPL